MALCGVVLTQPLEVTTIQDLQQHFAIYPSELQEHLTHLITNKSERVDEIHQKLLVSFACRLLTPLAKLFNQSTSASLITVEWKRNKKDVTKYRPVCLNTGAWKIL